jgi:hypothetical protein
MAKIGVRRWRILAAVVLIAGAVGLIVGIMLDTKSASGAATASGLCYADICIGSFV